MPIQLVAQATSDGYVPAAQLGPDANVQQLRFTGYNAPFVVQLWKYAEGFTERTKPVFDSTEYVYAANAGDVFGPEVAGARFRSYTTGKPASIFATLAYDIDPPAAPIPPLVAVTTSTPEPGASFSVIAQGHTGGTHGTPTALAGSTPCDSVVVRALPGNSGIVYLGDAAVTTANGYELSPGDALALDVNDVDGIFFDVDTTGDGVSWLALG